MTDRQRNGFVLLLVLGLLAGSVAAIGTVRIACGVGTASPDVIQDFRANYKPNKSNPADTTSSP